MKTAGCLCPSPGLLRGAFMGQPDSSRYEQKGPLSHVSTALSLAPQNDLERGFLSLFLCNIYNIWPGAPEAEHTHLRHTLFMLTLPHFSTFSQWMAFDTCLNHCRKLLLKHAL